jgi:ATP-dependent DNA helicase RecQ
LILSLQNAISVLKQYWGYDDFRPVQQAVVEQLLNKKEVIGILPTGGGKSICFQVPAMLLEGTALVVSPLISLIDDQVNNLKSRGISAVALHSRLSQKEYFIEIDNIINGKYKFIYVSPEKLLSSHFQSVVLEFQIALIAIDEAHCISMWGFDFRPAYRKLDELIEKLPKAHRVALTASATDLVIQDIREQLRLKNAKLIRASLVRKNLRYAVLNEENISTKILELCKKVKGTGLIYTRSRKETVEFSRLLKSNDISSDFYHAGLPIEDRIAKQEQWMNGEIRVMVCTNAFGMGIDKSNVRFVFHTEPTESLAYYYQEAGRAGRDNKIAYCGLLYNEQLLHRLEKRFDAKKVESVLVKQAYDEIFSFYKIGVGNGELLKYPFDYKSFIQNSKLSVSQLHTSLLALKMQGVLQLEDTLNASSKIQIICDHKKLEQLQNDHEELDKIIKVAIRKYAGIYHGLTDVDESFIAKEGNCPKVLIEGYLKRLHELRYIDYQPCNTKNSILFLLDRVAIFNPHQATLKAYNIQQQIAYEGIVNYITETKKCRNLMISNYFGIEQSIPCGHCDNCRVEKKSKEFEFQFLSISEDLKLKIKNGYDKATLTSEIKLKPYYLLVLQELIERKLIRKQNNTLIWKG